MHLNLNDAQSIVLWWQVWPERHDEFLSYMQQTNPQFAPAIREAREMIALNPSLSGALARSVREREQREAQDAARQSNVSSLELRWRELAAAA